METAKKFIRFVCTFLWCLCTLRVGGPRPPILISPLSPAGLQLGKNVVAASMAGVMGLGVGGVRVHFTPATAKRVVLAEKGHNLKL